MYVHTWEPPSPSHLYRYDRSSWEEIGEIPIFVDHIQLIPCGEDTVLLSIYGAWNQLWISENMGASWEELPVELPYSDQIWGFYDFRYDPWNNLVWATTGCGVCYMDAAELAVSPEKAVFHTNDFSILKVFPNPFNDNAKISFRLNRKSPVRLSVYNLGGKLEQRIFSGTLGAGLHEYNFSANERAS